MGLLCRRTEAAASGDSEEEERKVDSRRSALQDNAPAHTSQVAMAAVTECGFKVLPHPLYSPDLDVRKVRSGLPVADSVAGCRFICRFGCRFSCRLPIQMPIQMPIQLPVADSVAGCRFSC